MSKKCPRGKLTSWFYSCCQSGPIKRPCRIYLVVVGWPHGNFKPMNIWSPPPIYYSILIACFSFCPLAADTLFHHGGLIYSLYNTNSYANNKITSNSPAWLLLFLLLLSSSWEWILYGFLVFLPRTFQSTWCTNICALVLCWHCASSALVLIECVIVSALDIYCLPIRVTIIADRYAEWRQPVNVAGLKRPPPKE